MSLNKQLWIAIVLLMVVIFSTTFVINGIAGSRYLERQLTLKNSDDAAALALSLSQQNIDATTLEIQLSTLLDQGTYQRVSVEAPDGATVFSRSRDADITTAPHWLRTLFPIQAEPGFAQINSGWTPIGTLSLESAESFAYEELWASARRTLIALLIAITAAGAVGSALLNRITRPLRDVVDQANRISDRRFTQVEEPYTTEFAQVTRALNRMTERVREMLDSSSQRLASERDTRDVDAVTGMLRREAFMERFAACLASDDAVSSGSMVLLRLQQLAMANQVHGRATMDEALQAIGKHLQVLAAEEADWIVGRLGGADLALLAPRYSDPKDLGIRVQSLIENTLSNMGVEDTLTVPMGCCDYSHGDDQSLVLTDLDAALLTSLQTPGAPVTLAQTALRRGESREEQTATWRRRLEDALQDDAFELALFPVASSSGVILHNEGMLRLRSHDTTLTAATILPWAYRLGLISGIDRAVFTSAIDEIAERQVPICINVTLEAVSESDFVHWLEEKLRSAGQLAQLLRVEVSEASALLDRTGFATLQDCLGKFGVQLGLDHVGFRVEDIGLLSELGVAYLKVDAVFVRDLANSVGKRSLLQTYATITKTLGIDCIAEGVASAEEWHAVFEAGATGASGPEVTQRVNDER